MMVLRRFEVRGLVIVSQSHHFLQTDLIAQFQILLKKKMARAEDLAQW